MQAAVARIALAQVKELLRRRSEPSIPEFHQHTPPIRVALLVVQPSPFCNLDCDYCYLPDRDSKARLDIRTLQTCIDRLTIDGLIDSDLTIVWHAGEPLTLPPTYYAEAFAAIRATIHAGVAIRHAMQTNGTLIDSRWCELFLAERVGIGVSVDGPAEIHDRHRLTRDGKGTHARVMRGIKTLHEYGIPFHAIAVITGDSLDHADEIFDFFLACGAVEIGFNVEEIEGIHESSSLGCVSQEKRYRRFMERLFERSATVRQPRIREFDQARFLILGEGPQGDNEWGTRGAEQVRPFSITSIDYQGNLSTFSPELLGYAHPNYGDFRFANLLTSTTAEAYKNERFRHTYRDILLGIENCRRKCEYFDLCGGGAPANKLFEKGTFAATETLYCRLSIKVPIDIVLTSIERRFGICTES